jgi:preprotein translocase subunit SecE
MSGVQVLQGALFTFLNSDGAEFSTKDFRALRAVTNKDIKEHQAGFSPAGFVRETKEEFAKVVWPDRQQLISESAAVILMVALSALSISLVDNLFQWLSQQIFP